MYFFVPLHSLDWLPTLNTPWLFGDLLSHLFHKHNKHQYWCFVLLNIPDLLPFCNTSQLLYDLVSHLLSHNKHQDYFVLLNPDLYYFVILHSFFLILCHTFSILITNTKIKLCFWMSLICHLVILYGLFVSKEPGGQRNFTKQNREGQTNPHPKPV